MHNKKVKGKLTVSLLKLHKYTMVNYFGHVIYEHLLLVDTPCLNHEVFSRRKKRYFLKLTLALKFPVYSTSFIDIALSYIL